MLEKCKENCIETEDASGGMIEKTLFNSNTEIISSEYVLLGEDMNLCSIDVKSTDSVKKIIAAFDKVLCTIKEKEINTVYDDIDVTGSCITKTLNIDLVTGKKTIKLAIDPVCIKLAISATEVIVDPIPFIIHADKYSICGTQATTLISNYTDTAWYNQQGIAIGTGTTKVVLNGGNYYAVRRGIISNIVNVIYKEVCDSFSYTKVKSFYKTCPTGTTSNVYTYTKVYFSETSYQDALNKSELDSNIFNQQGQYTIDATGVCFGVQLPPDTSCFNVFLSNVISATLPPTLPPVVSCVLSLVVTNITCTTPIITIPLPPVVVVVDSTPTFNNYFINYLKYVPVETALGKYNPDAFPTISVVNTADSVIGNKLFPNWSISWKVEGLNFLNSTKNKKTPNLGIPFMFDMLFRPYGGYGQRCVDYVYPQDPSNGQIWTSDTACTGAEFNQYFNNQEHTIANFSSALPFQERAGDGGGAGLDKITEWNGISDLAYFYDQGHIGGERFGFRDWVSGKANVALADYDNEGTFDTNKSLSILLGLASKSTGYVFDQYSNILGGVYIDPSQYPISFSDPLSAYPRYSQLIDGNNGEPNSGNPGLVLNGIPNRQFWDPSYKISIPSKFAGQKGIIDEPTILPCVEVSCLSSATFKQGDSYVYDNAGNTRVVNKFGLGANTQHMIARTIFAAETHKWYCVNKLNNRKMIIQAKILCDQQQNGLLLDTNYGNSFITNTALANKHFDRKYSFMIGAFVAFTGCEWNIWDRNQMGVNLDGYHGAFGIINLLNQKKNFAIGGKSFVDLKPLAKFLLWTSEISYDDGITYVQDKANNYVMDKTKVEQRQFVTSNNIWGVFIARPENTEIVNGNTLKTVKLRISYNGTFYYHTVTADMWETTSPAFSGTALADLPISEKHYYYNLIDLTGSVAPSSTTSTVNNNVNVFVFAGESNAGTRNSITSLNSGEGGLRAGVKIWNNSTNQLEQLNVGVNNYQGETAAQVNGWGWEVQLANLRANGTIKEDFIIVKTAQGGARIGNYNSNITDLVPNYFDQMVLRINGVKAALQLLGKTPVFYIMYSQGINNALAPMLDDQLNFPGVTGIDYWKAATKLYSTKLRIVTGANTKISYMKFFSPYGDYLNTTIQQIVDENLLNSFITTEGLGLQVDGLHFNASGTRSIVDKYITALGIITTPLAVNTTTLPPVITSDAIVTEPNKAVNYYKSVSGNTEVISNYVLNTDDNVYIQNDKIKVGFSLRGGGAITYMSVANSTLNIINNHDMGRQIQPDYYQSPNTFNVAGKQTSTNFPNNGYNTTLGGDDFKNSVTLKEYYPITNGYYVKLNPLIWGINGAVSEITIEITYVLTGSTLKTTYKYTSNRTDSQIITYNPSAPNVVGQAIPAIYLNKFFTNIQTYDGTLPWSNASITNKTIVSAGDTSFNAKEKWTAISAPTKNLNLGVYSSILDYVRAGRKNVVNEIEANDLDNACTLVEILDSPSLPDSHNSWSRTDNVYYTLDTIDVIRAKAAQLSGNIISIPIVIPTASTTNNITNTINCTTSTLTVTGNFISTNNFGMSLITGTTVLITKDNLTPGNFNQVFTSVPDGNYFIKLFEINKDTNTFSSSAFIVACVNTPVVTTPITIGGVTITVPNKPQYYFSNNQSPSYYASSRANLPAIFTNSAEFDPINDIVYLENADVKYGINLKRGGQLCYASVNGTNNNLIFNGYDGGFQSVIDATQILLAPALLQGRSCQNPQNNNAYNTTMGGTYLNQSQTLMDYHTVGTNGYYVKFRPLMYAFDAVVSEVEIEVTYTLVGRSIKIDYKYTSFRTDGQYPLNPTAPQGLKGWAVPICFLVEKLNRYQTYTGSSAWNINSPVEDGAIPNTTPGQNGGVLLGKHTNEFWGLSYNATENVGLGSLNISEGNTQGYMTWEQREKYAGNPVGGVFGKGGRTTMDILIDVLVPDGGNYVKSTTAYVAVGTPLQIRQSFYTNTGH